MEEKQEITWGQVGRKLFGFLCGMKCSLILLSVILAACTAGSVVPQNQPQAWYEAQYGGAARWIMMFSLDDVFGCTWFGLLSALLALNLVLCSIVRFPHLWKQWRTSFSAQNRLQRQDASFVMELPLGIRFTQPWYRYAWGILYANGKSGLLKANAPLWFLPCMFCVLLMLYGVAHLAKGKKLVYAALTALSAAVGLLNERFLILDRWPLGFETALHMLPFALMGYAFRSVSEKIETMPDARKAVAGIALLAAGTAVQMGFDVSGLYMFDRYSSLALLYVCALAISVGVALLGMVRVLPRLRLVSYVGGHTFVILLLHKFPLLVFRYLCPGIGPRLLAGSVPLALAATAVTLALCLAAEKPLARICPALLGRRRKQAV